MIVRIISIIVALVALCVSLYVLGYESGKLSVTEKKIDELLDAVDTLSDASYKGGIYLVERETDKVTKNKRRFGTSSRDSNCRTNDRK